ncbi:MAG TPA: DUF2993 domain-containing protein [Acidimicrobiales bacterium]|nr:DUF2993 domain-containing protein [Acidimicrobiales bacterium]
MRKLIFLGVVVALLGAGDLAARSYAETKLDARARQEVPPGSTVDTSVGGFPFLGRLALNGTVSEVDFRLENVDAGVVVFASVDVDLHGVHLDRQQLFSEQKARLTSLDRGTVTVDITEDALSNALRVPVTVANGNVTVRVLTQDFDVVPRITAEGSLRFEGQGLARALTLVIPKTDTVPCVGRVTVLAGRLRLVCSITEIPEAFLDAAERV